MFTSFHMGHWMPLTWMSYALDHAVGGMEPRGYHATNLVLHGVNALLVMALAAGIGRLAHVPPGRVPLLAIGAALLFALHPLRVESVAWITERRDVLSGTLLLAALVCWLKRFRVEEEGASPSAGSTGWYVASLVLFVLSLGAKAWGITLPVTLLILDLWPLRRRDRRRMLVEKLPLLAAAAGAAFLALGAQDAAGARGFAADFSLLQRGAQACFGLGFYVTETLAPVGLNPLHLLDRELDPFAPAHLIAAAGVALGALALFPLRRRAPAVVAAVAVYVVTVSPVLGWTQSGFQLVADRYSYLACIPFALLAAAGLTRLPRGAALGATALLALVLGTASWRQCAVWSDSISLWDRAIELDRDNYVAWTSRASARLEQGEAALALGDLERAVALAPDYSTAREARAQALWRLGRPQEALADLDRALRLDPESANAWSSRGFLRLATGDPAGALGDLDRALALRPGNPRALASRGGARLQTGDPQGARADLTEARARGDASPETAFTLGQAHRALGDGPAARAAFLEAASAAPAGSPLRQAADQALRELGP